MFQDVNSYSTREALLAATGLFPLYRVLDKLDIPFVSFLDAYAKLSDAEKRKSNVSIIDAIWTVSMPQFADFVKRFWPYSVMPRWWNGNHLLAAREVYFLTDVADRLPITHRLAVELSHTAPNPRERFGIWFHEYSNQYLVDLSIFGPYFKQYWRNPCIA